MKRKHLLMLALTGLLLAASVPVLAAPPAQTAVEPPPAVIRFTVEISEDSPPVTVNNVEAGEITAILSWHAIHLRPSQRIVVEMFQLGEWVSITDPNAEVPVSAQSNLVVEHTMTFSPPVYRVSIQDAAGNIVSQAIATLPYDMDAMAEQEPTIAMFASQSDRVPAVDVASDVGRLEVSWRVENHWPTANLLFDQVLPDGSALPVELPREFLWVGSEGEGLVRVNAVAGSDSAQIRLRVIDVISGDVYDEEVINVLVSDDPAIPPAPQPTPVIQPETPAEPEPVDEAPVEEVTEVEEPQEEVMEPAIPMEPVPLDPDGPCNMTPQQVAVMGSPDDDCGAVVNEALGVDVLIEFLMSDDDTVVPGETIGVSWVADGADSVSLMIYHLADVGPGADPMAQSPVVYDELPFTGRVMLPIPAGFTEGARVLLWAMVDVGMGPQPVAYDMLDLPAAE
jgi:hypothetical protein